MSKINRRYIDKHWLVYIWRGVLATMFGILAMFNGAVKIDTLMLLVGVFLLTIGAVDATNAIFNASKKRGWINSVIDALIDVVAAMCLLFVGREDITTSVVIISVYTILSGVIDIFHGFLSTVDPTDRFIRVLMGACGCVIGVVILNAGDFEMTTFLRFFGTYVLIVGVTSLIYGVHNRSQEIEDRDARRDAAKEGGKN